jgi:hypothetical protein
MRRETSMRRTTHDYRGPVRQSSRGGTPRRNPSLALGALCCRRTQHAERRPTATKPRAPARGSAPISETATIIRHAKPLARARGFVLPEIATRETQPHRQEAPSASEGINADLRNSRNHPPRRTPRLRSGLFVVGDRNTRNAAPPPGSPERQRGDQRRSQKQPRSSATPKPLARARGFLLKASLRCSEGLPVPWSRRC